MSTFHGLETARRAINTQQTAIHTTGHNIANAGTEGYSRQRVNMSPSQAFPGTGMNRPGIPGQIGTGVEAQSVARVRDDFLDDRFRSETSRHGEWSTRHSSLERVEDLFNETSGTGIGTSMDRFWQSLQDLSTDPSDTGLRTVLKENGTALAESFKYTSDGLDSIRRQTSRELEASESEINGLLGQISAINEQITSLESHGQVPNDLYDARDRMVDELSGFMNISVDRSAPAGSGKSAMAGGYTINLLDQNGLRMDTLVDGAEGTHKEIRLGFNGESGLLDSISTGTPEQLDAGEEAGVTAFSVSDFTSSGKLRAQAEFFGYTNDGNAQGTLVDIQNDFDTLAYTYITEFNALHEEGFSLDGEGGGPFFEPFPEGEISGAAGRITVHQDILDDVNNIAASSSPEGATGNGSHAAALGNMRDKTFSFGGTETDAQSFYQSIVGDTAVKTSEAGRMAKTAADIQSAVGDRRESVSGVSLDEEMSNLVQFQHAYNAAARSMTAMDEMLDRIINGMGVVGR
ncbi:flagellar hook-associated protein FlgK [Alteribacter natronophilus]|uniref:flagellar hook-associated protein FlgK n=1 Tax=Alteribacter natronophilus TaxID=2583810 RepID=UPI00110DE381|nr:flagellar hook-associated protein FlgK [Alteribacter natronophilus]TMW72374.1 flagellar hook-associated protein FlgK [Alteribacter natronophilus]